MDVDEQPRRVMADSNVLIAGVLKPRWFFEFLSHAIRGDFQLILAPQTVAEVLRWAETKGGRRKDALEFFLVTCRFELAPDPGPAEVQAHTALVRDVTDVPVALSAIKARVDYLVTNDDDFYAEDTRAELKGHGIQVMLVGTFLAEVMGWQGRELEAIRHREWSDLLPLPLSDSTPMEWEVG